MCNYSLLKIFIYFVCIFYLILAIKYIHIGDGAMQFEIKKEEFVNKTFRIKKELAERLSIAAADNNVSLNEFVVQSCEFALQNLKPKQDK